MSVLLQAKAPSLSAFFMAAAASVLLLLVARMCFSLMRLWSCPVLDPHEKECSLVLSFIFKPWGRSLQWNTLPASLPFTSTRPEKPSPEVRNGVAVGLSQKRPQSLPVVNWHPRSGPRFQPPPPALYENPVPLSMAKIIMSRHVDISPTESKSVPAIIHRHLRPTNVTPADTFSPIPLNSIALAARNLPLKTYLTGQYGLDLTPNVTYSTDTHARASRLRLAQVPAPAIITHELLEYAQVLHDFQR